MKNKEHWNWSGRPKWHYLPGVDCPTSDTPPAAGAGDPGLKTAETLAFGYFLYRGIRMLPSIIPVFSWTIPGNIVAP